MSNFYHIVLPDDWAAHHKAESYSADSLESEGFIHCSFAPQLEGVLERYYDGVAKVVILEIDPAKLESELKVEPSTNDELYPHIYGEINPDSVVSVSERILTS